MVRIRPGAAGTIDSIKLIQVGKYSDASDQSRFFDGDRCRFDDGPKPRCVTRRRSHLNCVRINRRLCAMISALGHFPHSAALGCRSCFPTKVPNGT
jgi:hypothetical protein